MNTNKMSIYIYRPIPEKISYIYRLSDLDLSLNRLSSPIPESIGKMSMLGTLNLDVNMISSKLPETEIEPLNLFTWWCKGLLLMDSTVIHFSFFLFEYDLSYKSNHVHGKAQIQNPRSERRIVFEQFQIILS